MTWPQHQDPGNRREAKAPYNFVPLPEKVHRVADPPRLDVYHTDGRHTGWLDCSLTTASPLYVRCGLRPDQVGKVEAKDLPDFFYTDPDSLDPVIPGSSLRGMLRALVEIVSYSKVQPVGKGAKMTFRAVAAPGSDPLSRVTSSPIQLCSILVITRTSHPVTPSAPRAMTAKLEALSK